MSVKKVSKKVDKKVAKKVAAKPAVAKKTLVRPDQVVITKSHLTKIKNEAMRAKAAPEKVVVTETPRAKSVDFGTIMNSRLDGTASTRTYTPVSANEKGIVSVRDLSGGSYRVRVHLADGVEALPVLSGWTQPSQGNRRHSTVVSHNGLVNALNKAALALA